MPAPSGCSPAFMMRDVWEIDRSQLKRPDAGS